MTAAIGASIDWLAYEAVYWLNPIGQYRPTSSWATAFIIGAPRQHAHHRRLAFADDSPYWRSLGRADLFHSRRRNMGSIFRRRGAGRLG